MNDSKTAETRAAVMTRDPNSIAVIDAYKTRRGLHKRATALDALLHEVAMLGLHQRDLPREILSRAISAA